ARYPAVLVTMAGEEWRAPRDANPRQEHLAALQDVRAADRRAGAEAARPAAGSGDGSPRATARPRAGARAPGPQAHRHDPGLREHPAGAAQARGGVLRGQGRTHVERIKPSFESGSRPGRFIRRSTNGDEDRTAEGNHAASTRSVFKGNTGSSLNVER